MRSLDCRPWRPRLDSWLDGAATRSDIEAVLRRILYDEDFRLQIERSRGEYFKRFAIGSDGRAAARSADAVLALAPRGGAV